MVLVADQPRPSPLKKGSVAEFERSSFILASRQMSKKIRDMKDLNRDKLKKFENALGRNACRSG
jgi:hypothetical protein